MKNKIVDLVIWDLDDTFWKGTLSEGPIDIIEENCTLVKELVKRHVKCSICSKNDFDPVKEKLTECMMWQYFESPSINWESKAHRIRNIIKVLKIQPDRTLFIDDKDSNLKETKNLIPNIQVLNAKYMNKALNEIINSYTCDEYFI